MIEINLANSDKKILVDDEDYHSVSAQTWFLGSRSITTNFRNKTVTIGQFLLSCHPLQVDHKDRNIFNNSRNNLRPATNAQNQANKQYRLGISGFRGVTWSKKLNKWQAQITINSINNNLGYYTNKIEAAKAYNAAALKAFGEFATLNVIPK